MPLLFVDEAVERGKRLGLAERIRTFQSWFASVADDERWDVRLQFASKAAFERASNLLDVPPDPYLVFVLSSQGENARSIARLLLIDGRSGHLQILGGDPTRASFVSADLPPGMEDELDRLSSFVGLGEERSSLWKIAFWDQSPVSVGPSDGIRRAYEAAAEIVGSFIPFAEWWPSLSKLRRQRSGGPSSGIDCSVFTAGEIPTMVDVDGTRLPADKKARLVESWLEILPPIFKIEASGRFSIDTVKAIGLERMSTGSRSTSWRWEVDTLSMGRSVLRNEVFQTLQDPTVIKGVRSWQLRAREIRWSVPDPSIISAGDWNAVVLAQAPHAFRQTIRITLALEDMEGTRFQRAMDALRAVPAPIQRETSWILRGDPEESERGRQQGVLWTNLEGAAKDFLYRRSGGFLSELVGSVRKTVVDETQVGPVQVKRTLVDSLRKEISDFPFDPEGSRIGAPESTVDQYTFVRRRPSGTRNFILFDRERRPYYARTLWIRIGVSAVRGPITAPWGLRLDTRRLGWTEIPYSSQSIFDRALNRALKRLRKELVPFFDEVEPHLLALRSHARA